MEACCEGIGFGQMSSLSPHWELTEKERKSGLQGGEGPWDLSPRTWVSRDPKVRAFQGLVACLGPAGELQGA